MTASDKRPSRKQHGLTPRRMPVLRRAAPVRTHALRGVDAALSALSTRLPDFRIFSLGEKPTRRPGQIFFCGLERRTGGGVYLGHGRTMARAIDEAVELAGGLA